MDHISNQNPILTILQISPPSFSFPFLPFSFLLFSIGHCSWAIIYSIWSHDRAPLPTRAPHRVLPVCRNRSSTPCTVFRCLRVRRLSSVCRITLDPCRARARVVPSCAPQSQPHRTAPYAVHRIVSVSVRHPLRAAPNLATSPPARPDSLQETRCLASCRAVAIAITHHLATNG